MTAPIPGDASAWPGLPAWPPTLSGVAGAGASLLVLALFWGPFLVTLTIGAWHFFSKAGLEGWSCLVPGYNAVQLVRVARLSAWWAALLLVPGVNLATFCWVCVRVARAFGKPPGFAWGLTLLPPVYVAVLGLGAARYRRFDVVPGAGPRREEPPSSMARAADEPALRPVPRPVALG